VVAPTKGGSTQGASTQGGPTKGGPTQWSPYSMGPHSRGPPLKGALTQRVEALLSGGSLVGVCFCAEPFICGGPPFRGGPGQLPLSPMTKSVPDSRPGFILHDKVVLCDFEILPNDKMTELQGLISRGGHGLPKVSLGPAIPP
jgi:hypothetical protein